MEVFNQLTCWSRNLLLSEGASWVKYLCFSLSDFSAIIAVEPGQNNYVRFFGLGFMGTPGSSHRLDIGILPSIRQAGFAIVAFYGIGRILVLVFITDKDPGFCAIIAFYGIGGYWFWFSTDTILVFRAIIAFYSIGGYWFGFQDIELVFAIIAFKGIGGYWFLTGLLDTFNELTYTKMQQQ